MAKGTIERWPCRTGRLAFALLGSALLAVPTPAVAALAAVGPTSPSDGFPVWYRDASGLALQLCLDGADPFCGFAPGDVPDATRPIAFPGNFPEEAFYMLGQATMDTSAGRALLVVGLEAAFAQGPVAAGDQIVFGRVRIRVDLANPGHYVVTHPYGVDEFDVAAGDRRAINSTEDIGLAPLVFTGVLASRIGPFLTWDPIDEAPAGYVGDPAVDHVVTGSPHGTNFFRIEGPGVGTPGSPFLCTPTSLDCIQTDLFALQGKITTVFGVDVDRATYARAPAQPTSLSVFATSAADQALVVGAQGVPSTRLIGEGASYYALLDASDALPAEVTVTNTSDRPPSAKTVRVQDQVTIKRAVFDTTTGLLRVDAVSSDAVALPKLSALGFGELEAGVGVFPVVAPPSSVTVRSSAGGFDTEPVELVGSVAAPRASAGPSLVAQQGQVVTLDGSGSTGAITSVLWTQLSGTPVSLDDPTTLTPSFTAPGIAGTLAFQLQVSGPGGSTIATVSVEVAGVVPPVAEAGPAQTVAPGTLVTLDGSGSLGATTFAWTQVAGTPAVSLANADAARATFVFPAGATALVFQLTVSGPGGTATDTAVVAPLVDVLTATAEFRSDRSEWRIEGTATSRAGNRVTIFLSDGRTVVGTADVDALGAWRFRQRNAAVGFPGGGTLVVRSSAGGLLPALAVSVRN